MNSEPELIADYACVVGEGPLWHPGEKKLYWTDIARGFLYRYDPSTGRHEPCFEGEDGEAVGGFTMQADGALLLFTTKGHIKRWQNGNLTMVVDGIASGEAARFNDVIADPQGRVFAGTVSEDEVAPGGLLRIDTDGSATQIVSGIGISNGLGFTPDRKQVYYTDSSAFKIYVFDYEEATGAFRNQRIFAENPESEGLPDGMTVDAEGSIWSARWDGSCLVRFAPDGTEVLRIPFPVKKVSSVTFGGEDYTDMYVTTAGGNEKETDGPLAGSLFRLRLGIQGVPEFPSRIRL